MHRCFQALLIFSTAAASWLLMLVVHEAGHVLHGWLSGATLDAVHLPLFGFSRTDFADNSHPLFVAWGGPCWGCILPLAIFLVARCGVLWCGRLGCRSRRDACTTSPSGTGTKRHLYLLAWFAGFCLLANGSYLLGGAILSGGADDGGVILQNGGERWQLLAFGVAAVAAGLYLWNGLGPYFGLGASRGEVDRKAAVGVTIALVAIISLEALLANR